jgi:hypothetical protein
MLNNENSRRKDVQINEDKLKNSFTLIIKSFQEEIMPLTKLLQEQPNSNVLNRLITDELNHNKDLLALALNKNYN